MRGPEPGHRMWATPTTLLQIHSSGTATLPSHETQDAADGMVLLDEKRGARPLKSGSRL
jgi:hypothetical protein